MGKGEDFDPDVLALNGIRENNLKNLKLRLAHDQLIAVTGVSGSGKTTLAFDTIYAEGGRRYIETFSPYTRQFLDRLHRPEIDSIQGVRPALALEQHNRTVASRSTVGTVTEINDYLKIIWSNLAELVSPDTGKKIQRQTPARTLETILEISKTKESSGVILAFPVRLSGLASIESLRMSFEAEGFY